MNIENFKKEVKNFLKKLLQINFLESSFRSVF